MTNGVMIGGTCDERFARVREAFEANFESGAEVGASFAATVEGSYVVDLWGDTKTQPGLVPGNATPSSMSGLLRRRWLRHALICWSIESC